jgi:hypothetical protein
MHPSRIRGPWWNSYKETYNISYSSTNAKTALYIIGILILTVVLEVAVHTDLGGYFKSSKPATKADEDLLRVILVLQPLSYSTYHYATQKARLYHLYCAEKARSIRSSFWLRQPAHRR